MITAVDIADGPLLQRSIRSVVKRHTERFDNHLHITPMISDGDFGEVDHSAPASIFASGSLDYVLNQWNQNRTAHTLEESSCVGTCSGNTTGAGIVVNYSSSWQDLDIGNPSNINATLFSVQFNRTIDSEGLAILDMIHLCK